MNTENTRLPIRAQALTSCEDNEGTEDAEDLLLQTHHEVAEALRQAYQLNKQAERYHLRGAGAAALHQVQQAGRQVQRAQARLQRLLMAQEKPPALPSSLQALNPARVQRAAWTA